MGLVGHVLFFLDWNYEIPVFNNYWPININISHYEGISGAQGKVLANCEFGLPRSNQKSPAWRYAKPAELIIIDSPSDSDGTIYKQLY